MKNNLRRVLAGVASAMLVAAPSAGQAESPASQAGSAWETWINGPGLTGNWGGARTTLRQQGIDLHGYYLGELGRDAAGGKRRGTDYTQQITIGADWDLQKLINLPGAKLHTYVEDRVGRGVTADYVGGTIVNNTYFGSGENFRLMSLSYEQNFAGGRVNTLVGYYVAAYEFAYATLLCGAGFMASSFCSHPQFLGQNTGYQTGPVADWGGRIRFGDPNQFYFSLGTYEVNPTLLKNSKGFDLSLKGATGTMTMAEFGYTLKAGPQNLVGHYKIGGIYDSSHAADAANAKIEYTGRYDGWIMFDQQIYKTPTQLITLFGEAGIGDQRTAVEDSYLEGGFLYQGIIPGRPEDSLGVGYVHATTNPRKLKTEAAVLEKEGIDAGEYLQPNQQLLEVNYNIALTRWFWLTPDFQYFWNPGSVTFKHYDNATILSLQSRILF